MRRQPSSHPFVNPGRTLNADHSSACPLCGQVYERIPLRAGERALCARCGATLAQGSWLGPETSLGFAVTGLLLAIPAIFLPFVTASKFGNEHTALLFSGVAVLWKSPTYLLSIWVLLCGGLVPILLLSAMVIRQLPARFGAPAVLSRLVKTLIAAVDHWAIPEVQVLAVLVALIKLGSLVDVKIGPGFWCYGAMSLSMLLAWRSFLYEEHTASETASEASSRR